MISALFLFLLVTRDRRFPLRQRPDSVARIGCRVYAQSTAWFGERHIHVLGPVLGEPDVREFLRPENLPGSHGLGNSVAKGSAHFHATNDFGHRGRRGTSWQDRTILPDCPAPPRAAIRLARRRNRPATQPL